MVTFFSLEPKKKKKKKHTGAGAHHGLRVLVVDKGEIGSGETSRTTAHCFSWLDDWYTRIEHIHGVKGASLAAESHQEAIDFIERVCKYEDIECDMHRLDGWLLQKVDAMPQFCHDSTSRGKGAAAMIQEFGAAQRAGCHDVELLHLAPIPGVDTGDTVRFPMQAAFHPVKYINGLARAATSRGAQIYTNTRVVDFDHIDNNRAVIKTANGLTIYARHLVFLFFIFYCFFYSYFFFLKKRCLQPTRPSTTSSLCT